MIVLLFILLNSCTLSEGVISIIQTAISCDKTDFLLRIQFNESFSGTIYTEKGDPNCIYLNATKNNMDRFDVKIPLNGCETHRNADGHLENEIIVQNGAKFNAKTDKKYLLTCIPAAPIFRDSQVTLSFGGITIDTEMTTAATLSNTSKLDYRVVVLDGDSLTDPPLTRPLAVGDKVTYTVHLSSSVNGRIGRCWASDGLSELELSDAEGCSLQRAGEVWGDFDVSRDDKATVFMNHIKAWAFPTSNEVNIFCNLHVCPSCKQLSCRNRNRRVPASHHGIPPQNQLTNGQDLAPPIALRASFRLRRESIKTGETQAVKQEMTSSASRITVALMVLYRFILTVL